MVRGLHLRCASGVFRAGSIQVMKNTGGVTIKRNTVDGNLQCKENSPPPKGSGNVVHGNKEDQCARL